MIGLVFIFFIGKAFYDLANNFEKNKWVFGILGVVSYYAGEVIVGVIIGISIALSEDQSEIDVDSIGIRVAAVLAGIASSSIFYLILKRKWANAKDSKEINNDVLDGDLIDRNL